MMEAEYPRRSDPYDKRYKERRARRRADDHRGHEFDAEDHPRRYFDEEQEEEEEEEYVPRARPRRAQSHDEELFYGDP